MNIKLPPERKLRTGLTDLQTVDAHLRRVLSPVVNQINKRFSTGGDKAEVIEVYATEEQLPENEIDEVKDYNLLGAVKFRKTLGQSHLSDDQLSIAFPLNVNIVDFPVRGEYVSIRKTFGKYYYSKRINLHNNPNNASQIGLSTKFNSSAQNISGKKTLETADTGMAENKESLDELFLGEHFKPNFNIRQLVPNEGDTLIQGRFGNTLRLGSVDNTPVIKLRAGQLTDAEKFPEGENLLSELDEKPIGTPLSENINFDGSSMWMTVDEIVPLTPATLEDANIYPTSIAPQEFSGKQVIMNSGRLIFNSKEDGILGFSNGPIDFSTLNTFGVAAKQRLNLYSPTVVIGRNGEQGKTKNITLTGQDIYLQNEKGYTSIMSKGIELGSDNLEPAVRGDVLEDILSELMDVLSDLSSAVIKIATTPIIIVTPGTPTPQPYAGEAARAAQVLSTLATLSIKLNTMKSRVVTLQ